MTGAVGDSLSVECRYEEEYSEFHKYWCRQPCFPLWQRTLQTSGPEVEVKSGRVSITDHPEDLAFTVTLESLTADDAGPGDGDGQGGLACCDSWYLKESDTTEQLN